MTKKFLLSGIGSAALALSLSVSPAAAAVGGEMQGMTSKDIALAKPAANAPKPHLSEQSGSDKSNVQEARLLAPWFGR
ncbi:MAG: hypothetical protein AAGF48_03145 [Pseudomonadota bacterium]